MAVTEKTKVGMIDMTPTWAAIMPALIAAIRDGTPEGQRIAEAELMRLAKSADAANAANKAKAAA
jgi:hypothetical protein